MLIESETLNTILCASQDPLPSHVFSGGHIWEENGRLQSILTQALEVIYGRKTEDFNPFSLKHWRSYMGGKRKTSIHSHSSTGGHIWEETEDFNPFSLKRWRSYMGGKRRTSIHSHSSAGGHIWEETEDFDPFSLKRYSLYLTLLRSHHPTNFFQQTVKVRPRKILGRKKFPLLQIWIFPTDLCRFL